MSRVLHFFIYLYFAGFYHHESVCVYAAQTWDSSFFVQIFEGMLDWFEVLGYFDFSCGLLNVYIHVL